MGDDLSKRMDVVERLTNLFRAERLVYLGATIISVLIMVGSALSLVIRDQAGSHNAELTALFGSSGVISYSVGRLLFMWGEALKRLMPSSGDGKENHD